MYFYIYDEFLTEGRFQKKLAEIESELSLLDIKGPISRLRPFTKMNDLVSRALTRGATTLIAVGDDRTLLKLVNALPAKKISCGLICLTNNNTLAKTLNLNDPRESVEALAARKLITINLGKIGKDMFLREVEIAASQFTAIIDNHLILKVAFPHARFTIENPPFAYGDYKHTNYLDCRIAPHASKLFTAAYNKKQKTSRFLIQKMTLKSQEPLTITIDREKTVTANTITCEIAKKTLTLIVGKKRFA